MRKKIIDAQELLSQVNTSRETLEKIVEITTSLGIKTHRADIIMEKTARALAALSGRKEVNDDDIKEAALLALPHRMRQLPYEKGGVLTEETIETILHPETEEEEIVDFDKNVDLKKNIEF